MGAPTIRCPSATFTQVCFGASTPPLVVPVPLHTTPVTEISTPTWGTPDPVSYQGAMPNLSFLGAASRNATPTSSLGRSTSAQVETLRQSHARLETLSKEFKNACDDLLVGRLLGKQLPKLQRPAEAALKHCEVVAGQATKVLQALGNDDEIQRLRERLATAEDQLREESKKHVEAQTQMMKLEDLCKDRQKRFHKANNRLQQARADVTKAEEQKDEHSRSISALREELSGTKVVLTRANTTLAQNTLDLDALARARGRFQHHNHALRSELTGTTAELAHANKTLNQTVLDTKALKEERSRLQRHNEALGRQICLVGSDKKLLLEELKTCQVAAGEVVRFWRRNARLKADEIVCLQAETIDLQDRVQRLEHDEYLSAHEASSVPRPRQHARGLLQSIEVTLTNALEDNCPEEEFAARLRTKCDEVLRLKEYADDIQRAVYTIALSCKAFRPSSSATTLIDSESNTDTQPEAYKVIDTYGVHLTSRPWTTPCNTFVEPDDGRVNVQKDVSPASTSPSTPLIAIDLSGLIKQEHKRYLQSPSAKPHVNPTTATSSDGKDIFDAPRQTPIARGRVGNMRAVESALMERPFITQPPKHPRSWDLESDRASKRRLTDRYRPRYSLERR